MSQTIITTIILIPIGSATHIGIRLPSGIQDRSIITLGFTMAWVARLWWLGFRQCITQIGFLVWDIIDTIPIYIIITITTTVPIVQAMEMFIEDSTTEPVVILIMLAGTDPLRLVGAGQPGITTIRGTRIAARGTRIPMETGRRRKGV